jgi:hypothetical protein
VERTILSGPQDHRNGSLSVNFPIRHKSWTGRPYTCYHWNDLKRIISWTGKRNKALCTPEELERLLFGGFQKPSASIEKELRDPFGIHRGMKCTKELRNRAVKAIHDLKWAEI